jgi:hypothetical protein
LIFRNRYYYWNTQTDEVCWISPSHPKAKKEIAKRKFQDTSKTVTNTADEKQSNFKNNNKTKRHDTHESSKHFKQSNRAANDPMDPSSYSDVSFGKWGDGLNNNN